MKKGALLGFLLLLSACAGPGDAPVAVDYELVPVDASVVLGLRAEYEAEWNAPSEAPDSHVDMAERLLHHEYRLGAGDRIRIRILIPDSEDGMRQIYPAQTSGNDIPNLVVPEDGILALPFVGELTVRSRTVGEVRDEIRQRLVSAGIYLQPEVQVDVTEYASQFAMVTGAVKKSGVIRQTHAPLTVLHAIEAAEGVTEAASLADSYVTRANGDHLPLRLDRLMRMGDAAQNVLLRPGDTLHIASNHRNRIFVLGEVERPVALSMPEVTPFSVVEALVEARGPEMEYADLGNIYVVRGAVSEEMVLAAASGHVSQPPRHLGAKVYHLDATEPQAWALADQMLLRPRDVVYVSTKPLTEWSRFISQLIPLSIPNSVLAIDAVED